MLQIFNKKNELELKYLGFTKIGKLDKLTLNRLNDDTRLFINQTKNKFPKGELFNLINSDFNTKSQSNKIIDTYLNNYLKTILDLNKVDVYPVSHIVKPFGLKSSIWHQDSAIVDERESFSLNAWVPLVNSNLLNGCLWIFPGSHISNNFARQFGYNPIQGKLLRNLRKYLKPIYVEAGEIVLFHRNLIHGSSINWLPFDRIALESVVVSKNAQLYNFHREESMAPNKVLGFKVTTNHFYKENPKEDFYNGSCNYIEFDDDGFEGITEYLINSIPSFFKHAQCINEHI
jgi:hypothetical protein